MATVSQFAAPRDGDASFWFASDATALGLPGAPERGVSFTVRGPQGWRGFILAFVRHHSSQDDPKVATVSQFAAPREGEASFWSVYNATPLGLPGAPERGDCFAVRSPKARQGLILVCA